MANKGVSDSCDTAVMVTHKLGQEERRCVIHIVVIPERRLLTDPKEWVKEGQHHLIPLPLHFEGMEDLRKVSLHYYRNRTNHKTYKAARNTVPGCEHCTPPKPDTAKWESRHALVEHCKEDSPEWKVLLHVESNNKHVKYPQPPLPNGAKLQALREIAPVLQLVAATVSELQGDNSNLAKFWPTISGLIRGILKLDTVFAKRYVEEMKAAIGRHLKHPIRTGVGAGTTLLRLTKACSLTLPAFRQGRCLDGDLEQAKQDFASICESAWKRENPTETLDEIVFQDPEPQPGEAPASKLPPKRRRLEGKADLLQNINEAAGLAPDSAQALVEQECKEIVPKPVPVIACTVRHRMEHQLAVWHDTPGVQKNWQEYWCDAENRRTFHLILQGVLDMLSESSQNGWGERFFGKSARVIQKLSGNLEVERKLALHANGCLLGMEAYRGNDPWEANAQDFEFWEGKSNVQELL